MKNNIYSPDFETLRIEKSSLTGELEISFVDTKTNEPTILSIPKTATQQVRNFSIKEYALEIAKAAVEELSFSGELSEEEEYILTQENFLSELVDEMIVEGVLHEAIRSSIQVKVMDELAHRLENMRDME